MKHHFADFLDRSDGDYWSIVPNIERYSYTLDNIDTTKKDINIITIGKEDKNWELIFAFNNLEELTLHEPSKEQLKSIGKLKNLKRLRITHARIKDIHFITPLTELNELVLEYVSGFEDISPIASLVNLKSLYIENLSKMSNFEGLSKLKKLRYLRIDGTLDKKQTIDNFNFLYNLSNLEILSLGSVINKTPYPALLPIGGLTNIKKISIPNNIFSLKEYALMEVILNDVDGASWDICERYAYSYIHLPGYDERSQLSDKEINEKHPEVLIKYDGLREIADANTEWLTFLGKNEGRIKSNNPLSIEKCNAHKKRYLDYKKEASNLLKIHNL